MTEQRVREIVQEEIAKNNEAAAGTTAQIKLDVNIVISISQDNEKLIDMREIGATFARSIRSSLAGTS